VEWVDQTGWRAVPVSADLDDSFGMRREL